MIIVLNFKICRQFHGRMVFTRSLKDILIKLVKISVQQNHTFTFILPIFYYNYNIIRVQALLVWLCKFFETTRTKVI